MLVISFLKSFFVLVIAVVLVARSLDNCDSTIYTAEALVKIMKNDAIVCTDREFLEKTPKAVFSTGSVIIGNMSRYIPLSRLNELVSRNATK